MNIIQALVKELNEETAHTRKMLERIPNDRYDWQPHVKSMTMRRLAAHIADLPNWIAMVLNTTELDLGSGEWQGEDINDTDTLLAVLERSFVNGKTRLEKATEEELQERWVLRYGDQILSDTNKYEFVRISIAQMIHHRAQMGVFLRLLDIPIPGPYGPSADEMEAFA